MPRGKSNMSISCDHSTTHKNRVLREPHQRQAASRHKRDSKEKTKPQLAGQKGSSHLQVVESLNIIDKPGD